SSNNVAINALAMNANDLKVQLNNSGIQNATLNFNGEQQQSSQQQNQQARQEYRMLQEFDSEDKNEEILSSLEIVVPSYA
ncbi:MAG: flagellar hook-length control protein FliK, partial [Thiovulaceae bacterium]|nr:flagellar hook-length control protein FliK [Sulfurimonadaceae bacterium]